MVWIKRGYLHLLNNLTSTLTLSNHEFDTIGGEFGGFIEKNLTKMLKNHDRRPCEFLSDSPIKNLLEEYQRGDVDLYDVSVELADLIFKQRDKEYVESKTGLFIMEVGTYEGDYLMGLDLCRMEKFQIVTKGSVNSVVANPMLLANATPKKSILFTIDLRFLKISILENESFTLEQAFGLETYPSLNQWVHEARSCLYNIITKIEGRPTYFSDIEMSKNEEKIEIVNKFEDKVQASITVGREIDFEKMAEVVFENNRMLQDEFIKRLKNKKIQLKVKALSDGDIAKKKITPPKKEKRLTLKNGIEVIVPDEIEEIGLINIQNINGKLTEVENNEEV